MENGEPYLIKVAYSTPVANLDKIIEFDNKGFKVVSSYHTPIAKIIFFDAREQIGVFTEVMGITKEVEKTVEKMKGESN